MYFDINKKGQDVFEVTLNNETTTLTSFELVDIYKAISYVLNKGRI